MIEGGEYSTNNTKYNAANKSMQNNWFFSTFFSSKSIFAKPFMEATGVFNS